MKRVEEHLHRLSHLGCGRLCRRAFSRRGNLLGQTDEYFFNLENKISSNELQGPLIERYQDSEEYPDSRSADGKGL